MDAQAQNYFRDKQVIVLGAGYIGGQIANECLKAGARVTALTRNSETASKLAINGIEVICDDIANDSWHDKIGNNAEFCLNCISSGRGGFGSYQRSYVEGMRSVSFWLRKSEISTITYTSSTSVYPHCSGETVDEKDRVVEVRESETVGCLLQAERILMEQTGHISRWFILRLAGIYGPTRHQMLEDMINGDHPLPGDPAQHLNLIYRDDAIQAILDSWIVPKGKSSNEIFNVVDEGKATRGEIASWLAKRLGLSEPAFSLTLGERSRRPARDRIINNEKIRSLLGWHPAFPSYKEGYEAILSGVAQAGDKPIQ